MGGYGSSRWHGEITRSRCNNYFKVDIRPWGRKELIKKENIFLETKYFIKKGLEAYIGVYVLDITKIYLCSCIKPSNEKYCYSGINEQFIELTYTSCNYGNKRVWFSCPFCHQRVALLYLKNQFFACRKCHDLAYRSSQISGDKMDVIYWKIINLAEKIGEYNYDIVIGLLPDKPKGMHRKTYDNIVKQIDELRNEYIELDIGWQFQYYEKMKLL